MTDHDETTDTKPKPMTGGRVGDEAAADHGRGRRHSTGAIRGHLDRGCDCSRSARSSHGARLHGGRRAASGGWRRGSAHPAAPSQELTKEGCNRTNDHPHRRSDGPPVLRQRSTAPNGLSHQCRAEPGQGKEIAAAAAFIRAAESPPDALCSIAVAASEMSGCVVTVRATSPDGEGGHLFVGRARYRAGTEFAIGRFR